MKALVLEEYKKLVYRDVPDPDVADNEVLVRVKACGICGSDVHGLDGSTGRRIPPLIMGHEASGIVESAGNNVSGWNRGDRVTFDSTIYRLDDWYTLNGQYNLSDNREVIGVSPGTYRRNGAFAELISVPPHVLYRIPGNVSFEHAAMTEAIAVSLHAVKIAPVSPGSCCVVIGAGTIGLFVIKLLKLSGASPVIAVDIDRKSLEMAVAAGADHSFAADEAGLEEKVRSLTYGRGAETSFEVVGKSETVKLSVTLTRRGGRVILVGNTSPFVEFPLQKVVTGELKVMGSCAIRGEYEAVLHLLSTGRIRVDDQIRAVVPLRDGAEWFGKLYNRETGPGKVILVP